MYFAPRRPWSVDQGLRRNDFVSNILYSFPFGTGRRILGNSSGALNSVIGGWTVASITRLASPTYQTPLIGSPPWDVANDNYSTQLPNIIAGQSPNLPAGQRPAKGIGIVRCTTRFQVPTVRRSMSTINLGAFAYPGAPADDPLCLNSGCQSSSYYQTGVGPGVYGNACIGCLRTQRLVTQHLNVAKLVPLRTGST